MTPTSLILTQHTIMKPTASHFIDGVVTRLEAAARIAARMHRNAEETNIDPASPNRSKTGGCGPTGAVVVSTGAQRPYAGTSATPQGGLSDAPTAALVKYTTKWLAQCRLSGARPNGNKQMLGNYATTAGQRPCDGNGNDNRLLTVSLGIQGRSHDTAVGSKARGRAPRPNIAQGGLCVACSREQRFDAYM